VVEEELGAQGQVKLAPRLVLRPAWQDLNHWWRLVEKLVVVAVEDGVVFGMHHQEAGVEQPKEVAEERKEELAQM
jgi:hypothetical protein